MATILIDTFNTYNNGALNGQGSWSGSNDFIVQEDVVREGSKAIEIESSSSLSIERTGLQVADGRVTVYLRIGSTNGGSARSYFILREGVNDRIYTKLEFQTFSYQGAAGWVQVATGLAVDVYHCIEIEWRSVDRHARYRADKGVWTAWVNILSYFTNYVDKVVLNTSPFSGTTTNYFDYIIDYMGYIPVFKKP